MTLQQRIQAGAPSLVIVNANVYTPTGTSAVRGASMASLSHLPNCQIEIDRGTIAYVGPERETDADLQRYDAHGRIILPGFVDAHTHIPFAGNRADEFSWRLRGDSYMSIMERGGGIVSTMKAVRDAAPLDLTFKALDHAMELLRQGVTTIETKSGYGLDKENELKQLRAIAKINAKAMSCGTEFATTFLGAHAVPPEYAGRADEYIDFIISDVLPAVAKDGLAEFCDVFCEKGVFTIEQSRRLLLAAKALGLKTKVHADEITCTQAASLAAEIGATSADHLLHVSDQGIADLAKSDTIAVLLPLTAFTLNEPYAPARKLIDAGCAVALGTDFNPGSCYTYNIPLMLALACIHMRMTIEETISALTLNSAAAIGRASEIGSIEPGKQADLVEIGTTNLNDLVYCTGRDMVHNVFKAGQQATSFIMDPKNIM